MKTRFAKYGNSMHLRIPSEIIELIKLDADKDYDVDFAIDGDSGCVVIKVRVLG